MNIIEYAIKRRMTFASNHGEFRLSIRGAMSERRVVRQHAASLLIRAGYDRIGQTMCDACVDLCRRRTEIWREEMPKGAKDVDAFIATLKCRAGVVESHLNFFSAVAVGLGEPMVNLLLDKYASITEDNAKAWSEHYEKVYKKNKEAGLYKAPIEPWIGFACAGAVASDNTMVLHKLAELYSQKRCSDAIRGLAYAQVVDGPVWDALFSAASSGDWSAIEALGKIGDQRALDAFSKVIETQTYFTEQQANALATALGRYTSDRAGLLLADFFAKRKEREDNFVQAVASAFAGMGYAPGIPVLMSELNRLKGVFGAYPDCLVKKDDRFGYTPFRSSSEASERCVGPLTLALGRLRAPEVKETIGRILRNPVDRIQSGVSTWTITHSPWTLYQATLAARAYGDSKFLGALQSLLHHGDSVVRYGAVVAIESFMPNNRNDFSFLLADADSLVRQAAVRAQGKILTGSTDAKAIEPVITLVGDADEDVRSAARAAIATIGKGAIPALKKHANDKDLWLRVGALSCLAEMATVKEFAAPDIVESNTRMIHLTNQVILGGEYQGALLALNEAWRANVAAGKIVRQVHLVFHGLGDGEDRTGQRSAVRRWIMELDRQFPQVPFVLADPSLSAWLTLRLPQRKLDIAETQSTNEYGGGGSRAALLLELVERSHVAAREVGGRNWLRRRRAEKAFVDRLFVQLQ